MIRLSSDYDRGRDSEEYQERGGNEASADAEYSGNEPRDGSHSQEKNNIDRDLGDREINIHRRPKRLSSTVESR